MLINELCTRSGLSKDTIRHYEDVGLIRSSKHGAGTRFYRHFDEETLEQLEFIRNGVMSGFSLKELKTIKDRVASGKMTTEELKNVIHEQIIRIENRVKDLNSAKRFLRREMERVGGIDLDRPQNR